MPQAIPINTPTLIQEPGLQPIFVYHSWPTILAEKKQLDEFCWVDLAHVVMLVEHGTIPRDAGKDLIRVIQQIRIGGEAELELDPSKEGVFYQIEARLACELGEYVAGFMHTARSRIDQRATIGRLFYREPLLETMRAVERLQQVLITCARKHATTVFPYHTHMQQSQPGTYGHYLMAQATKFQQDFDRCQSAYQRLNLSPLGTVGRNGTSLRINRQRTAELLAFDGCVENSLMGKDADWAADVMAALSFIMSHLNMVACDLQLWSSNEFAFCQLPDGFCERSSLFPQKRNPVTLETIKLAAGSSVAWLTGALATARGLGTGDHSLYGIPADMQQAIATTTKMLELAGLAILSVRLNETRIGEVLADSWSTTTRLGETLISQNKLSVRQGYAVVADLVSTCRNKGIRRSEVTPEMVTQSAQCMLGRPLSITQDDLRQSLDPYRFVANCISEGSVGPVQVEKLIQDGDKTRASHSAWLRQREDRIADAQRQLDKAALAILSK